MSNIPARMRHLAGLGWLGASASVIAGGETCGSDARPFQLDTALATSGVDHVAALWRPASPQRNWKGRAEQNSRLMGGRVRRRAGEQILQPVSTNG